MRRDHKRIAYDKLCLLVDKEVLDSDQEVLQLCWQTLLTPSFNGKYESAFEAVITSACE